MAKKRETGPNLEVRKKDFEYGYRRKTFNNSARNTEGRKRKAPTGAKARADMGASASYRSGGRRKSYAKHTGPHPNSGRPSMVPPSRTAGAAAAANPPPNPPGNEH